MSHALQYWKSSSLAKGEPQELNEYQYVAISVFKLSAIPDFASGRFKSMEHLDAAGRVGFIASLQKNLIKGLAYFSHLQSNLDRGDRSFGYSLRIIHQPTDNISRSRTNIYLIARVASKDEINLTSLKQQQKEYIETSLRSQLYQFEFNDKFNSEVQPRWLDNFSDLSCYEILKPEEIFNWSGEEQQYFYSPGSFQVNKGNDMTALFEQLQGYQDSEAVCIDLTLVPTIVSGSEKKTISKYIEVITAIGRGIKDEEVDPDSNSQKAKSTYEDIKKQYYSGTVFLSSFRVFSLSSNTCQNVASQLAASCHTNATNPRIVEVKDKAHALRTLLAINIDRKAIAGEMWDLPAHRSSGFNGAPETLRRLHRLVDLDEAAAFFRLPIPINQACAGVTYDGGAATRSEQKITKSLTLGKYSRNGQSKEACEFDLEQLKTHMLIVGGSGSGKTTTTFNLLTQLWGKHQIPFIVFDPKVTPEYRYLKRLPEFKDDLLIFTPGQEFLAPFRFNPFEVMSGVPLQEHVSRIFDCFMGALPLEDPLPSFLQEAIDLNYKQYKWDQMFDRGGKLNGKGEPLGFPTMQDLYDKTLSLAQNNYGKDKEVGDRIKGALRARLYRLTAQSGIGAMLQASRPLSLDQLMTKPVIFELGGLNQEEQSLFSLFILSFIFEYVRVERVGKFQTKQRPDGTIERATDLDLRHVILVEEAHNMLGQPSGESSNTSQGKVVDKFAQIMREMRSAGEGVVVVDQSPAALATSIVDATNLKLMHRLPSPSDREYLGKSMCLTEGESQLSGIFSPGEAFYYVPGWDSAKRIAGENFKAKPGVGQALSNPLSDDDLKLAMGNYLKEDTLTLISGYKQMVAKLESQITSLEQFAGNEKISEAAKKKISGEDLPRLKQSIEFINSQIKTLLQRDFN
jgi:DNA helicase HerA-like ATPase